MELLVWHAALGSDDEQATDAERAARLLYAHTGDDGDATARGLHALQFVEALAAFTRLLRPPAAEWVSATLQTRRVFIREVEPQIFFALSVPTEALCGATELRQVHGVVLQQLYDVMRMFHGPVDAQLRELPPYVATRFADGMALLDHLAALRRRLRKLAIARDIEAHHDKHDDTVDKEAPSDEEAALVHEIETLVAASPSRVLWQRWDALFPKLLSVMEIDRMNLFHEMDGVAYFPMDETTFLALQTLVNSLASELGGVIQGGVALFYRGNVLWRTMDTSVVVTLQRFLRLREQDGMDVASPSHVLPPHADSLWMDRKYDDAFSPVWGSKTTYAECAVVTHIAPQPRSTSRSLHKQTPSSMGTLVNELMDTFGDATASAEQLQIRRGQRYRSDAPVYRNRGFLTASGYFLPSWELAKPESNDVAWAPRVFAPQNVSDTTPSTALLYHENDLSLLLLAKPSTNTAAALQHMERIEDALEKVQFAAMATTIWKRYLGMTGNQPSREKQSSTAQPPYIYLNRVNLAFKASDQIPRLVKTKEPDLYPRPASLWSHYLPAASLALLNDAHATLNSDAETVELRVKTVHDGWLVAQRSHASDRELFALFDTKAASVADAQDATNDLLAAQFSNIYL